MIRIGFLLNHDAAHQVMHCIPTAFELARWWLPGRYRAEQERAFAEAFDLTDTPSAIRAADAITGFLANEEWPRPGRL